MDNLLVGLTGAVCLFAAETATTWYENLSPLAIVAFVVYYFLWKFDRKLDVIEDTTREIKEEIDKKAKCDKEDEQK